MAKGVFIFILVLPLYLTAQEEPDEITQEGWVERVETIINSGQQTDSTKAINPLDNQSSTIEALPTVQENPPFVPEEEPAEPSTVNELKLFGDHVIKANEVSYDRIRIVGGDLTVYGTVKGQISVIGGDVYLGKTAVVEGEIIAIGGNIHRKPGAIITGRVIETNLKEGLVYREYDKSPKIKGKSEFDLESRSERANFSWIHQKTDVFIYNRNEGLLITPFNFQWDRESLSDFRLSLSLGYRFGQKAPAGRITLEKSFFINRNFILYGSAFRESRTFDYYRLPEAENSAAAILGRQDFYDRWDERGYELGVGFDLSLIKVNVKLTTANEDSIPVTDIWSVFEQNRRLRPNLPMTPQKINYLESTLAFRTRRYDPLHNGAALFIHYIGYHNANSISELIKLNPLTISNRIFSMVIINWEFSEGIVLRSRVLTGTSAQTLAPHRYFSVGGLGSVSAFPYKYQVGDQFAQANIELIFTPEFLGTGMLLKVFTDGGQAWMKDEFSFKDLLHQQNNVISSVGIGIGQADHDGLEWGINFAQPLDGRDYLETTVRLNLNF
ncbi:MAG: hypothetical protein GXO92_07325 [FCB group bacterium]|nr:hypothetical protein [FCB group bacterium]